MKELVVVLNYTSRTPGYLMAKLNLPHTIIVTLRIGVVFIKPKWE